MIDLDEDTDLDVRDFNLRCYGITVVKEANSLWRPVLTTESSDEHPADHKRSESVDADCVEKATLSIEERNTISNSIGMTLRWIEAGSFTLKSENGANVEKAGHPG
ncbi:MAG: hypothetical protein WAO83_19225 [Fuerstiella sp.]